MKKYYLITGGSSGMGYQISKKFLGEGCVVFILSRTAESCDLKDKYSNCLTRNTDVSKIEDIRNAFEWVVERIGKNKLDGLINCAGIGHATPLGKITESLYDKFYSVNVKGLIFVTKIFLPLIKKDGGIICNFSSIAGIKGFSEWSLYCSSKYAVEGFSQSIKNELRKIGIRVVVIRPGSVDTPFYSYLKSEDKKDFIQPETVADIVSTIFKIPPEANVEDIFINNSVGDL